MTATIHQMTRVRQIDHLWVVEVRSPVHGRWIVQGEWLTKRQADADRLNF